MQQTSINAENTGLSRAISAGIVLKLLLFFALALNTRFVMDEFWQFGQAKYLWNGLYDTIWPVKAMGFALYYKIAHILGWDAVSMLLAGRILAAVLATATLAVVYKIARALGQDRLRALIVVLVILCFSTFMERAFRLRSEPVALFFASLALWAAVSEKRAMFWAGIASGCAFLATQKSVYFNAAMIVAVAGDASLRDGLKAALRDVSRFLVGLALALVLYALLLGGADAGRVFVSLFTGPAQLATGGGALYEGLRGFITQTLTRNLGPYAICAVGIFLALMRGKNLSRAERVALVFALLITALVFRHNQPWPYIFTMCIPFLALFAPYIWDRVEMHRIARRLVMAAFGVLVGISVMRNVTYLDHSNHLQRAVISQADALLAPGDHYFDGIGMLPNHMDSPRIWLDAPGVRRLKQADWDAFAETFHATSPKLVILNYRIDSIATELTPLISGYGPVGLNLLQRETRPQTPDRAALFLEIYTH